MVGSGWIRSSPRRPDDATARRATRGGSLPAHASGIADGSRHHGRPCARPGPRFRSRRPVDRGLLAASLGIALGVVAIGYALFTATSASDRELPEGVESVLPVQDAPQALAQTQVIVDLAEGYLGEMTIDGTALETIRLDEVGSSARTGRSQIELPPGAVYEPGNATLTFTPRRTPRSNASPAGGTRSRWSIGRSKRAGAPPVPSSGTSPPSDDARRLGRHRSPVARSWSNPASSRIGTPSCSALVTLLAPGLSPATRA